MAEPRSRERKKSIKIRKSSTGRFLTRIDPRILIPAILIITWSVTYDFLIYETTNIFTLVFGQMNSITGLMADGFILMSLGLVLVGFYVVTNGYFLFMTDMYGFAKIEQSWKNSIRKNNRRSYKKFVLSILHVDTLEDPASPLPKSIDAITILLVAYYFVNLVMILGLTEIMYLTTAEVFRTGLIIDPDTESYLPIFATALLIGARGAAFLGYDKAKNYGTMVVETIYVFVLIGILALIFGGDLQTFAGLISDADALGRFLANALKLAMIPLVIELAFWVITLYRTSKHREAMKK
ncbi:MAG: hypothetical protein ACFFD4_13770 [Candidatus Odinarchaeota archaeon]